MRNKHSNINTESDSSNLVIVKHHRISTHELTPLDPLSTKGIRLLYFISGSSDIGGDQKNHGVYFYKTSTGELGKSETRWAQLGLGIGYYFNKYIGLVLAYGNESVSTGPIDQYERYKIDLYQKHIGYVKPELSLLIKDFNFGKLNLYGSAGGSYVWVKLMEDYKTFLREKYSFQPTDSYAKGFGWSVGTGLCLIGRHYFFTSIGIEYSQENTDVNEQTKSMTCKKLGAIFNLGYKFSPFNKKTETNTNKYHF